MRLLWKILLLSILIATIPLSVAGWKTISRIRAEFISASVNNRMESIAVDVAYRIDEMYIRGWIRALESIAATERLTHSGSQQHIDPALLLAGVVASHPELVAVQFDHGGNYSRSVALRADADSLLRANPTLLSTLLPEVKSSLELRTPSAPFEIPGLDDGMIRLGVPVEMQLGARGAITACFSLNRLQTEISREQFGERGTVFLVDSDGKVLAGPVDSARALTAPTDGSLEFPLQMFAGFQAIDRSNEVNDAPLTVAREIEIGEEHEPWRMVFAACQRVPWGVVVQEPLEDTLAPMRSIVRDVVKWMLLALATAIVGGLALSHMLGRPIRLLSDGAREIGAGNFDHQIPLKSRDELGELAQIFNWMGQQLKSYDELNIANLIREKTKTEAVLHNIADGVIVTGTDGEVLVVNSPTELWFDIEEDAVVGKPLGDCIDGDGLRDLVQETADDTGAAVHSKELSVQIPGQVRSTILHARATRVETERGDYVGVTVVLRDVTSEREIDRMKTELVSVVAHELRSPLVSIMGFSGILLEENLDLGTRVDFARIINDESNRMVEMINKFLDISRIESGKTEVVKVPTNVSDLARQVVDINRGQADARQIAVLFSGPNRITPITVDPDLIGQAVLNLFSNAIKYSPEQARIEVTVTEHRNTIEVSVQDTGYGISEEAQKHLFEKFYRADDDPKIRDTKGTGLGLSLVKEIVEQHKGRVVAESTLGVGSTFSIHLPKEWT